MLSNGRSLLKQAVLQFALGVDYVLLWATLHRRRKVDVGGLRVYDMTPEANDDGDLEALKKTEEAVRILCEASPRHVRRIRRARLRVVIAHSRALASYMPRLRAIVLNRSALVGHRPVLAATLLVHESTHVRFWKQGIRDLGLHRGRIENLCNREMLAFARTRPDADYLMSWMHDVMQGVAALH